MKNLFVVGNGFDLAHGLPTKYVHFRNYLIEKYPDANLDELVIPNRIDLPKGGYQYDDIHVVSLLLFLIDAAVEFGDEWSDFETSLGKLEYSLCFDDLDGVYDRFGDMNPFHTAYNNEDRAVEITGAIRQIEKYFSEWIDSIKITNGFGLRENQNFKDLIDPNVDIFLTFNYTKTLEVLYNAKDILHIHGTQNINDDLIFGHGNDDDIGEALEIHYFGAHNEFRELHRKLRKPTNTVIDSIKFFFDRIASESISSIYFFGFSFSEVDIPYIQEICKTLKNKPSIVCYLNAYDTCKKRKEFSKILRKCGFKGDIRLFRV